MDLKKEKVAIIAGGPYSKIYRAEGALPESSRGRACRCIGEYIQRGSQTERYDQHGR